MGGDRHRCSLGPAACIGADEAWQRLGRLTDEQRARVIQALEETARIVKGNNLESPGPGRGPSAPRPPESVERTTPIELVGLRLFAGTPLMDENATVAGLGE